MTGGTDIPEPDLPAPLGTGPAGSMGPAPTGTRGPAAAPDAAVAGPGHPIDPGAPGAAGPGAAGPGVPGPGAPGVGGPPHLAPGFGAPGPVGTAPPGSAGERAAARFGRFYAPAALALVALSFCPMFDDVVEHEGAVTTRATYGTLWDMASTPGGGPAWLGIMLMFGLVGLLIAATLRARPGRAASVTIACLSALITLMLATKPGTGDPTPSLTPYASAGLALVVAIGLLAIVHTIVLSVARTGTQPNRPSFWSIQQ